VAQPLHAIDGVVDDPAGVSFTPATAFPTIGLPWTLVAAESDLDGPVTTRRINDPHWLPSSRVPLIARPQSVSGPSADIDTNTL